MEPEPETSGMAAMEAASREAFEQLDTDRSGYLDEREVAAALDVLGLDGLEPEQVREVVREMDPDGDGRITQLEFQRWWIGMMDTGMANMAEAEAEAEAEAQAQAEAEPPPPPSPEVARLLEDYAALLALPQRQQLAAARSLHERLTAEAKAPDGEEWNSAFGPDSLYAAVAETTLFSAVHSATARHLRALLDDRLIPALVAEGREWVIVEIGGGNGRLWAECLRPGDRGELVLVEPVEDSHKAVAAVLPEGVKLRSIKSRVEELEGPLQECDALICNLVLHHVPGRDLAECEEQGLTDRTAAKLEVLRAFREALDARNGRLFFTDSDKFTEIALAPGDPVLAEQMVDAYIRCFGAAVVSDLRSHPQRGVFGGRWVEVVRRWALGQLQMIDVPLEQRDVYELTGVEWASLLRRAGFQVGGHGYVDSHNLFALWRCACGARP